jgi:hypothetical protein
MSQADFAYEEPERALALSAAAYATRAATFAEMREIADAAGVVLVDYDMLAELDDQPPPLPAEVLLIDCPIQEGATLAALARLDLRAAQKNIKIVISTTISALDTVFACLEQANATFLVDPTKQERVVALSIALAKVSAMRVRELDENDKQTIRRLSEQVNRIVQQLDQFTRAEASSFRLESPEIEFRGEHGGDRQLIRTPRPPLPDPRLVRLIIRQRQLRGQFFDSELFADPAWDMLLDLTAARVEHQRVSVTSLCIASGVPPTTALRWIGQMVEVGLLERIEDETDRRRAFIQLSDKAADAMARYFAELGKEAKSLV